MYLTDDTISTEQLQDAIARSPLSKPAVATFLKIYKSSKEFLDSQIFRQIRANIEALIESPLNLRKRLDKAKMGRYVALAELTHRRALPAGFEPLHLLGETTEQIEMDFSSDDGDSQDHACDKSNYRELQQERDRAQAEANRYYEQLKQYEQFCRFLLIGKILPAPLETNGLEDAPLLQVFGGARSLSEVHQAYRELRKAWHPDISPFSESETNQRFDWLKKAYTTLVNNWSRFDPQNMDIPSDRVSKLQNQQLSWNPESFWYWKD
jgi:hypothetical protein